MYNRQVMFILKYRISYLGGVGQMTKYRANIRKLDEEQKIKLDQCCKELNIDIEFSEIQPVGQPSKIDMVAFRARYKDYLDGHISATKLGAEFGLSKSGIYKKFKESKNEFTTRAEYLAIQKGLLMQQAPVMGSPGEVEVDDDFDDPEYKPFLEFEGFEEFLKESKEEIEEQVDDIFGEWDSLDSVAEWLEKEGV